MIKNYILRAAAMFTLLCGAVAVSCSNDDNGGKEPGPGPGPGDPIAATYSRCEYKGDFAAKGTDVFNLVIATGQVNASGEATGEGYIFNLNLNSLVSGAAKPIPANGTYNFDAANSFAANTISSNLSKATGYDKALKATPYTFSAAQVIVTKDGVNFKVTGEVTLNTNTKIAFTATVTNWVDLTEGTGGSDINYLAENLNLAPDYYAPVEFLGNEGGVGFYRISLAMSQNGPYITIFVLGPEATPATAAIPVGTFQMNDSFAINTAVAGSYDEAEDMLMGSFYQDVDKKILGLPVSGTVTISEKGLTADSKTVYSLVMDTKTAENFTLKVSFEGPFSLDNGVQSDLEGDLAMDLSTVASADARFLGDALNNGTGAWIIWLEPGTSAKDGFDIMILSSSTAFTFPTATFAITKNGEADTFLPGENTSDGIFGTYYYTLTSDKKVDTFAPAVDGTIKIEAAGANYKFTIDVLDDAGNKVTGTWTGPVKTTDVSEAKAPAKAPKYGNKVNKQMSNAFSMKGSRANAKSTLKSSLTAKFELAR